MAIFNTAERWGSITKFLHWSMMLVIFGLVGMGIYMTDYLDDLEAYDLIQTHKSWGFVAFSLAALRVVWRLLSPKTPDLPEAMPKWERMAAQGIHIALYVLIFALPLSGWLMASASTVQDLYGIPNMVFGLFAMPDPFVPGDAALSKFFAGVHETCVKLLFLCLALHVGGALKHHFVARDAVLRRMLPFGR